MLRGAAGSVSDAQIQTWIDRGASRIHAALFQRGIDPESGLRPDGQPFSGSQLAFLADLNEDYAAARLASVLESVNTLQPGEVSVAGQRRKQYETILADIRLGRYDAYFAQVSRIRGSIGGAETDSSTPSDRGENRGFGRDVDLTKF
jgi:hypothetical protein